MSSWTPTTYKTKNWSDYHRALKQAYSDAAIQACLTIKVLFGLPLRQATGFVERLLELAGLDWTVPDFSTLCRRQRTFVNPSAKWVSFPE